MDFDFPHIEPPENFHLANWKYEEIMEEIRNFEEALDAEHEIVLQLTSFGSSVTMIVTEIGYQNSDMFYTIDFAQLHQL